MDEEEDSQGSESKVFSVRIVSIDYYMSPPIPDFDISYSSFQGGSVKEVPVIRIYGSTPAAQKSCVHVHRALPYLYVPCSEIPLEIKQGVGYENAVSLAVDKALKLKGHAGSKRQHVHGCSVVRARKFYGYHPTEELFIKIYLYYPHDISRAASLMLDGAVFDKSVQPYEAHIPFLLQFLVDYNLYGMGHMHLVKMRFRPPVPDDLLGRDPEQFIPENAGATAGSSSCPLLWRSSTITDDWMWQHCTDSSAASIIVSNIVKRQCTSELEGDATVDDILNQQLKMYTSLSQTRSDVRMVQSLVPIWEEEFERSGVHDAEVLADPGKPLPEEVLRTLSNGLEFDDKLRELYRSLESASWTMPEDIKSMVSAQCLVEEQRSSRFGSKDSNEVASRLSDEINMMQSMGSDPEDLALLKWLASSQAAEEINSDDELHRETILNPLVPAATLDKVLEKANTDFESESQQECQDILDSVQEVVDCDEHIEKASSSIQHNAPLPGTIIPQLDGSGDDQLSPPAAIEGTCLDRVAPKRRSMPLRSTTFDNKRNRHEVQWGSLPLSEVKQSSDGNYSGSTSMNASDTCSGQINDGAYASMKGDIHNNSDILLKNETNPSCSAMESRRLLGCSVRELMRKKRCLRVESSEQRNSEADEFSKKEVTAIIPRKLDFDTEQSVEKNMQDPEVHFSDHGQINEQMALCDIPCSSSSFSCQRETKNACSLVNSNEKEADSFMPFSKSSSPSLNKSNMITDSECSNSCDSNDMFVDETLRLHAATCSSILPSGEGKGKLCLPGEYVSNRGDDRGSYAPELSQMDQSLKMITYSNDQQFAKVGPLEHYASCSQHEKVKHKFSSTKHEGPLEYISMTFHKKPPVANWSDDTPLIQSQSNCCIPEGGSDNEGTAQGKILEDVLPFFVDSHKGPSERTDGCTGLLQNSNLGVPIHYRNDGSCAYILTPAISPPSVDSVQRWVALKDKGKVLKKPLPEYSGGLPYSNQSPLKPINNQVEQVDHKTLNAEGGQITDLPSGWLDSRSPVNVKEAAKFTQDISQISGPSGHSKPTPLSQIGFKDPASIGAGQQLTLLSIEVQAQCRGDRRPNPQHDAINFITLAVQNDNNPSVDIYVLLRGEFDASGRKVDGLPQYKVLVCPDEINIIDQFVHIIRSSDPDILIGWDVQGSSLGYLAERASILGVSLLNKISRTPSETKPLRKDPDIFTKEHNDSVSSDSLISHDNTVIEDEWGRTHASGVHVSGRIVLNVWRLVRGEIKLNMYTLEAVAEAVLRRKIPSIHSKILNKWFLSGPGQARFRCVDYFVERAKLNHEIVNQLDMVNRTSELARVFGIDFFSVLSRGSQYRVESMLIRLAHTQNYVLISPGHQQVASQPAMECIPLVMEPESGFYSDPVIVLDFQSLYPSMIIAYNLCFSTCFGNVVPSKANTLGVSSYAPDLHILKDQNLQMLVTPNGVMYLPSKVCKGVLPRLLEEILSTRIMVKKAMKKLGASQQILYRIFNSRQLALKLIANVTYGYTAAGFSGRMPCAELADSIVQCGRRTLEHAISVVNMHDQWDARVIYGDTDSMFVLLKGRSMKEAFRIGSEIASTISAMNPYPVTLKMEKVYRSCFLLTKKRYVGYSYETLDQPQPIFDAKGIETVRRDTCTAVAKTMEKSLRLFFEHQDISKVRAYLQRQWSRILSGRISIQDFVFAKEVRLGTYSARTSNLPPAAIVASKAMRADPRAEPRYAERVPYVVVHGEPGARLIDMVVDPQELLAIDSPYRLNDLYYITKQIMPALQRVFGLLGADLSQWFQMMPRQVRDAPTKHHFKAVNSVRARIDHYYSSRHCILCGELAQAAKRLCGNCFNNGPVTAAAMTGRTAKLEGDIQNLAAICRHCGGGDWVVESGVKCSSLACSVYYERVKALKELRAFSTIANEAGFYPKCMVEWF